MDCSEVLRKIVQYQSDPLGLLRALGGWYECPKDPKTGKRLGPLVGYAVRDSEGNQYVADAYANFALAEEWPHVIRHWAVQLSGMLNRMVSSGEIKRPTVFVGAPEGGKSLAMILAFLLDARFAYPDKVRGPEPHTGREATRLVFSRHGINAGDRVVIVEDVTNHFSTVQAILDQVAIAGGHTVAIAAVLNRSSEIDNELATAYGRVRVLSLVRQSLPAWQQKDPQVADHVATGNVIFSPKLEWPQLMDAMKEAGVQP